ncbi:MAG: hypothetical protein LZF61_05945 [Nitrosomonas sp.]|nr:MAG: hypothetical protein LZF61_05945 [Nitrosomonas sp.]
MAIKTESKKQSLRDCVLCVIRSSEIPLTGKVISAKSGLRYKQVIDALNALYDQGRVARRGRKFNSRWCSIEDQEIKRSDMFRFFDNVFLSISKKQYKNGNEKTRSKKKNKNK